MMLNKDKREAEYPPELESQFILRLPEKPAIVLKDTLKKGEDLNDRLTIQLESDMRHGEVCLDHWKMHAKIVDLPTITESVKTIDRKSFYKTADICQMMICSEEPDNPSTEDESPVKNKKKDPYKVDKKYLWPHGITPPTKNIRKRRFRKTLKKKSVEAPEIEKEVKRLLRADNEAISITWEVINEEDEQNLNSATSSVTHAKIEKKGKAERSKKLESNSDATPSKSSSNIVDIFGGAVSDSDLDEENINIDLEDCHLSAYDIRLSGTNSLIEIGEPSCRRDTLPLEFGSPINQSLLETNTTKKNSNSKRCETQTSSNIKCGGISSEDDCDYQSRETSSDDMTLRIEQLKIEVDEMKEKRQKMRLEIEGMENTALRKRFQDILHKLNQDIMYKEMQYQGMITLQNSEDI